MNRLVILSTVSVLMTTSANANHPDDCNPNNKECACHFEQDISELSPEKLLEQLPLKSDKCDVPLTKDPKQQLVSTEPDDPVDDDDDSNDHNDNDNGHSNDHDADDESNDHNDDDDDDNGHGNDHDKHDDSNPGKGHGHGRNKS